MPDIRSDRSNWLIDAGKLTIGETLILHPRGDLRWDTALEALKAQYPSTRFQTGTHANVLRVTRLHDLEPGEDVRFPNPNRVDGAPLRPIHILPYDLRRDSATRPTRTTYHERGELVGDSLRELRERAVGLMRDTIDKWPDVEVDPDHPDRVATLRARCEALEAFDLSDSPDGLWHMGASPQPGLAYVWFGKYRIELREWDDRPFDLSGDAIGRDALVEELGVLLEGAREQARAAYQGARAKPASQE